ASAVVASPDGKSVYVAGAGQKRVAVFQVSPTTHNLSFVTAVGQSHNADLFQTLAITPDGGKLFAAGVAGVVSFTRDASGNLHEGTTVAPPSGVSGYTALSVSGDGTL